MNENRANLENLILFGETLPEDDGSGKYGTFLHDTVQEMIANGDIPTERLSHQTPLEYLVRSRGHLYDSKEQLLAAYGRLVKAWDRKLLTLEEFAAELDPGAHSISPLTKELHEKLSKLVNERKLEPQAVYAYAKHHWCACDPGALIACRIGPDQWLANTCDTKITEAEAILEINQEWGFEAGRIKIIETPYYEATDWQFIRFACAGISWLWAEEDLYRLFV